MRALFLLLLGLAAWVPQAHSAIVFSLRGDSLDARYSSSGKSPLADYLNTDTAPAVVADATSGVFGGSKICLHCGTATQYKALYYPAYRNFSNTNAFTIVERIVPNFTSGSIPRAQAIFQAGIVLNGTNNTYLELEIQTDSTVTFTLRDRGSGADIDHLTSSAFSFTSGTPTDIIVTFDSSATPKLRFAQDGVSISTHNPSVTSFGTRWSLWPLIAFGKRPTDVATSDQSQFSVNELVIYDTVENFASFAGRSAFVTVAAFDGQSNSSPGDANVKTGVSYTVAGVTGTGTYDGSDRHTDPGVANVRSGTAYKSNSTSNNRTGTAAIPIAANVRSGTATDATTGTLAVPAASNVRSGTAVDNTTGTAAIPIAANVRNGTAVDATTGTLAVPAASNVRSTTTFDNGTSGTLVVPTAGQVETGVTFDNGTVGTYAAADRYTDPGVSNVLNGVTYKFNSTSTNRTGTLVKLVQGASTLEVDATSSGADAIFLTKGDGPLNLRATYAADGTAISVAGATFETYFPRQVGGWLKIANGAHSIIESGASNTGVVDIQLTAAETAQLKSGRGIKFYTVVTLAGSSVRYWGTAKEIRERPAASIETTGRVLAMRPKKLPALSRRSRRAA